MIKKFDGKYRWLSNFAPCRVVLDGEEYPSVEHAYQAAKTTNIPSRKKIQRIKRANRAKWLGKRIGLRPDWEQKKVEVMFDLLRQKFSNEPFRKLLLHTGKAHIQEGNTWGDVFWRVSLISGKGENMLGRLIMRVRDDLRDEGGG